MMHVLNRLAITGGDYEWLQYKLLVKSDIM